jgi:hypothetical protein
MSFLTEPMSGTNTPCARVGRVGRSPWPRPSGAGPVAGAHARDASRPDRDRLILDRIGTCNPNGHACSVSLEKSLSRRLQLALTANTHFDVEAFIGTDSERHLRVTSVEHGILTGIELLGLWNKTFWRCGGDMVFRITVITMIETLPDPEAHVAPEQAPADGR